MFRPVPMVHLQVQIPTRDGPAVTRRIAAQGLLHLIDIGHGITQSRTASATRELLAQARNLARTIRQTANTLEIPVHVRLADVSDENVADFSSELSDIRTTFDPIRTQAEQATSRMSQARDDAAQARKRLDERRVLERSEIDTDRLRRLRFACVRLGTATPAAMSSVADALTPNAFAIVPLTGGPAPMFAVMAPASSRDQLDAALRQATFASIDVGSDLPNAAPLDETITNAMRVEDEARRALATLRTSAADAVAALARRADVAVVLLQAQTLFATTGRFLVISGWIPDAQAPELEAAIARVTDGRAVVTIERPDRLPAASAAAMSVPILYRNPLLLRPFQALVDLYGVPAYTELQPTAFFAASFLVMFGLMFGDVGHGAVLLAAGYCLFRYMPRFLDYGILLMETGAASAAFGVLYGSVFGVDDWLPALWLHPIRDLSQFTRIAASIGVVMVSTGFLLGVVNTWRAGDRPAALLGVRGLFGAFAYWALVAVVARMFLPVDWTVPDGLVVTLCAAAAALLILRPAIVRLLASGTDTVTRAEPAAPIWLRALEGSIEIVDAIVAYFANTISFVRIAAFAAVHAAVLVAVFAMADTLARYRFGGPLSVAVLVGGNVLTILLEGLTVTVQVLRLEYYEFFGRFFRGGGAPYRPLMLRPTDGAGEP